MVILNGAFCINQILEFIDFTIGFNDVHKLQNLYYLLTGEELTLQKMIFFMKKLKNIKQ